MIEFSYKHPLSCIMFWTGLLMCSLFFIKNIKLNFYPFVETRKILVETDFENADAEEVRKMITVPLENAFVILENQKNISSISKDGKSFIQIEFHYGTDMEMAFLKTREASDSAYENFPSGVSKSSVRIVKSDNEYFLFALTSKNKFKPSYYWIENILKTDILRIKGVSDVSILGAEEDEIQIILDNEKLVQRKLTLDDAATAFNQNNFELPAGIVYDGENSFQVNINNKISNYKDIENITITNSQDSGTVRIKDLGHIEKNKKDKKTFASFNGNECILVSVKYNLDENPVSVSKNINRFLTKIENSNYSHFEIKVIQDSSLMIIKEIKKLTVQGIAGSLLTFTCLLFFFKSVLLSIVVSISIPLCFVFSLAVLALSGNSLNTISLSGLTLGIGLIVDCSAVTAERIVFYKDVLKGAKSIKSSNIGSTATTVLAFIPVLFIAGPVKDFFSCLSISIISCVVFSFFVSCSLTVAFVKLIEKKENIKKININFSCLESKYKNILIRIIEKPAAAIFSLLLIISFSIIAFKLTGLNLYKKNDSSRISINIDFPSNVTAEYIQNCCPYICDYLNNLPNLKYFIFKGGELNCETELSKNSFSSKKLVIDIFFNKMTADEINKLEKIILKFSKNKNISIEYENNFINKIWNSPFGKNVVQAETLEKIQQEVTNLKENNVEIMPEEFSSEWNFIPSMDLVSKVSVSNEYVSNQITQHIEGIKVNSIFENSIEIPCRFLINNKGKNTKDIFNSIYIYPEENIVPVSSLGLMMNLKKEKNFFRFNRKDSKVVLTSSEKLKNLENIKIIDLDKDNKNDLIKEFLVLVILVFILIYILIGIIFESFFTPVIICLFMFLSIPGAVTALFITGRTIDFDSLISFVLLLGLSANNTILLIEGTTNRKLLNTEIINVCSEKLKTLFITNGTTIISLLPFIFNSTISISIIGGLLFSFVLNIFLIPLFLIWRNK